MMEIKIELDKNEISKRLDKIFTESKKDVDKCIELYGEDTYVKTLRECFADSDLPDDLKARFKHFMPK